MPSPLHSFEFNIPRGSINDKDNLVETIELLRLENEQLRSELEKLRKQYKEQTGNSKYSGRGYLATRTIEDNR